MFFCDISRHNIIKHWQTPNIPDIVKLFAIITPLQLTNNFRCIAKSNSLQEIALLLMIKYHDFFQGRFIMSLANHFPPTLRDAIEIMRARTGSKVNFKAPDEKYKNDIQKFIIALHKYDADPGIKTENAILTILKDLDMSGKRLKEDANAMIFFPNDIVNKGDGVTLLWRQGKIQVSGQPETYNNKVMGAFISNEHMQKDFADELAIRFFLEGNIKGMLCNAIAFGTSRDKSPCQPAHKITDVAHSDVPLYYTAISQIIASYPKAPISNLHGMGGVTLNPDGEFIQKKLRAIFVNNFNGQFLDNGNISWPLLFAVALAQQDLPIETVRFGSPLPGKIVDKDGITRELSGALKSGSYFVIGDGAQNTTNVPGRVANNGNCTKKGSWLDKSMHMEWGPEYRKAGNLQDKAVAAFKEALYFYLKYIPEKHNVWALPEQITNNMRKYPAYFEKMLQQANKPVIFSAETFNKLELESTEPTTAPKLKNKA